MFGIGMTEIVVVLVIALLIFGPNKLPELARSLGKGFGEFRRASYDLRQSLMDAAEPEPPPRTRNAQNTQTADAGTIHHPDSDQPKPDQATQAPDPGKPPTQGGA